MSRFNLDFKKGSAFDENIIDAAIAAAGAVSNEDRISGASGALPTWQVVGKQSKDATETKEINGEEVQVSRAGQFRLVSGGEVTAYKKNLYPLVILAARQEQSFIYGDTVECRGLSTNGLYDPVAVYSKFAQKGFSCQDCPAFQFRKEPQHPVHGTALGQGKTCKSNLVLYVWNPDEDPEGVGEPYKIQFSSSSIKVFRAWAKQWEQKGVKLWSFWLGLQAKHNPGEGGKSDFYTPDFKIGGALDPEDAVRAESMRTLFLPSISPVLIPAAALTARIHEENGNGYHQPALPAGGVFTPEVVVEDPFADE